jgi:hypothetical protein
MKNLFLSQLLLLCAITLNAQLIPGSKLATTTTLPEGTAIKNGKITILAGYKAFLGEKDKKVVIVQRTKRMSGTSGGSGITGTFSCRCEDGSSGDCSIQVVINEVNCAGFSCK